ncbi:MAG TPA: RNB domain-containing ribonuclease [Vicinamibacteria bacterium]
MTRYDLRSAAREAMIANGFRPEFPPDVHHEVRSLPASTPPANGAARDLRHRPWSSIDNRESRDLDQLEWAEAMPHDGLRVCVAVADVDSLVPKGSATDGHAGVNTTSVYTGITVFPMLPERLSNDLTSLNPHQDRLAVVVDVVLGADGAESGHEIYRALVRNHAKLDYETVGAWLAEEGPLPEAAAAVPGLEANLRLQDAAAQRLLRRRRTSGVLSLETLEPRALVADGRVVDIQAVPPNRARDLIENFMVAANSALARYLRDRRVSSIRRVVRTPRRWDRIVTLAAELGEKLPAAPDARALSAFLQRRRAADPEHYPDLSLTVVKLLGSGEYVLERRGDGRAGEGHFPLAAAVYAHGTAPNRRYADLVTQRLVKAVGEPAPPYADEELHRIAQRCTEQEDAARKVERTLRKKAAAVLLADRVGERFTAIVTGASEKGTYVRVLAPPVEGKVVRGARGLDVGDTVKVTLLSADPRVGHIDFAGPGGDVARKLARSRQKKKAATRLMGRVGESFPAVVTVASPKGTYVYLPRQRVEGRLVRGANGLVSGQRLTVSLVSADTVHGFIDFENPAGIPPYKQDRRERKRRAALGLRGRLGQAFDAVVSGHSATATWVRVRDPEAEGRLVRGGRGLSLGQALRVRLVGVDPRRGFIDFVPD